jgi:hypothetical protein
MPGWTLGRSSFFVGWSHLTAIFFLSRMLKDDRVKQVQNRSIFVRDDFSDILG